MQQHSFKHCFEDFICRWEKLFAKMWTTHQITFVTLLLRICKSSSTAGSSISSLISLCCSTTSIKDSKYFTINAYFKQPSSVEAGPCLSCLTVGVAFPLNTCMIPHLNIYKLRQCRKSFWKFKTEQLFSSVKFTPVYSYSSKSQQILFQM